MIPDRIWRDFIQMAHDHIAKGEQFITTVVCVEWVPTPGNGGSLHPEFDVCQIGKLNEAREMIEDKAPRPIEVLALATLLRTSDPDEYVLQTCGWATPFVKLVNKAESLPPDDKQEIFYQIGVAKTTGVYGLESYRVMRSPTGVTFEKLRKDDNVHAVVVSRW